MEYEDLRLEGRGGVAVVTLDAPQKMNALTPGMRRSLLRLRDDLGRDDGVRVVVVTGAGRGFCSGADLSASRERPGRYERLQLLGPDFGSEVFFTLDKPVIAAVNGPAVGAGFSLALSCDIRLASEAARFGAVFVLRALTPDCGITYWLPRMVGMSRAMELMLTGRIIDAAEALRLGLVSRVLPPDELMPAALELAERIAAQPPVSVELSKRMVYRRIRGEVDRAVEIETYANRVARSTEDHAAAVRAFLEKRPPPRFTGC